MSKKSKCVNADEVRNEVEFLLTQWGEVLVEEFIQGREVTVLVSEDQRTQGIGGTKVYPPIEVKFPEGEDFKHFEVKWVNYEGMLWQKLSDEHLAEVCGEVSRRAFQAILGGISYGRTDLRVDDKGDVYFLEINPNCGIFYPEELEGSADFILKNDPEGVEGMAKLVMDAAWNRWQLKNKQTSAYEVTFRKSQGFMLRAARDIDEGEKVFDYEERSFHLASKNYIEKNWNQDQIKSFGEYAWPLSPQVFVLWDEDPSFWRPINHSCDPNVWLGENFGLDIFARRKIARGEQLSIDYATFCGGDYFAKFVCQCGSQNCREEVTGVDYTHNSQLRERFGTRVTDFVFRQ